MLSWAELLLAGLAAALTLILFTLARTERVAVEETQVLDFPEAGVSGRRRRRRRAGRAGSCSTGRRGGSCSTSSRRRVSKDRPEQGGELRARNTSLVRVNTRLVEQHRLQQERLEQLQESFYQLQLKEDVYNAKISELQTEIEILKTHEKKITLLEEEKEKLERMLREQQKVIKLALARILPRKQEITFCQEHLSSIREFENRHFY